MGAEAKIYETGTGVIKERIRKNYRIEQLDEKIRRQRTRKETDLINKARRAGVKAPLITKSDEYSITMQKIRGPSIKNHLLKTRDTAVCMRIGEAIRALHDSDIIHGDPTTSNMILSQDGVYVIDFGLGSRSTRIEDKAVDIHLFKQALESKHSQISQECFKEFLKTYSKTRDYKKIMNRLEKVEARGRYK